MPKKLGRRKEYELKKHVYCLYMSTNMQFLWPMQIQPSFTYFICIFRNRYIKTENIAKMRKIKCKSNIWIVNFKATKVLFLYLDAQKYSRLHKMLVTYQRFGDWFLFGLVWPYSSDQKNIMKVGSKSLLLTCSSNKLWAYLHYIFLIRRES